MDALEVSGLRVAITLGTGVEAFPVDGVSLRLDAGRVLGLVGESGCGKSMLALALLRLLPPAARIVAGSIVIGGRETLPFGERELRAVRGAEIAMVFQEPMTALNPVMSVGSQVREALRAHRPLSSRAAWERAVELLAEVGIAEPRRRAEEYPHQLSGGMRQRVMIAMAIACEPRVLVADEPTTALDVTIQAGILDLLARLRRDRGMALLLVSHDLGVVAEQADDVAIMYAGRIVERAPVNTVFRAPRHPYTQALLRSMPVLGRRTSTLQAIPGVVPPLGTQTSGCAFRPRCPKATAACANGVPPLRSMDGRHEVACVEA